MRVRVFAISIGATLLALGATCGSISPRDYEQYSQAAGLLLGEGDVDRGRATFIKFKCHSCHTVDRLSLPPAPSSIDEPVPLGGEVERLPTDGYLATAIINPSHELVDELPRETVSEGGESRMPDYSDVLSIRQLKDLVAFLHARYRASEE